MKINYISEPFPFIAIENTFEEQEINLIWDEIKFLYYGNKFDPPEKTGGAYDTINGKRVYKKNNRGLFLADIYKEINYSNIYNVNRKLIYNKEIYKNHNNWFFKNIYFNVDNTLLSYYENGGFYNVHTDYSFLTCLTWFFKEPKKFKGGNLVFNDFKIEIEVLNNSTIIFPSCINHSVTEISMQESDLNDLNGRICMTQFIGIELK